MHHGVTHSRLFAQVWCVPLRKPGATAPPSCKPDKIRTQLQNVLAQQVTKRLMRGWGSCGRGACLAKLSPHTIDMAGFEQARMH